MNFLKQDKEVTYLKEGYIEVYLPKWLQENDLIEDTGKSASVIGVFLFRHSKNEDMSGAKLYELKLPVRMTFFYAEKFNKNTKLNNLPEDNYIVYKLYPNSIFNQSNIHVMDILDVYAFLSMITGGKLPDTTKYSERLTLLLKNLQLNGTDLKIPYTLIEIMVSELARSTKDLAIPFRIEAGKTGKELGYEQVSIKELAMNNSTFSALTFEDLNQAIISSVNKTRNNSPERDTPVETVIKY